MAIGDYAVPSILSATCGGTAALIAHDVILEIKSFKKRNEKSYGV